MTTLSETPATTLTPRGLRIGDAERAEFGARMAELRQQVVDDLGQSDVDAIRATIRHQRRFELTGRLLLEIGWFPPAWLAGTASLTVAKILDNMEIGHNIMHGQYDWTGDPDLRGRTFEWDSAGLSDHWRRSHNVEHHTWTNVVDKDRDVGYGILRMDPESEWSPADLLNPVKAIALGTFFQYGVMLHELHTEQLVTGGRTRTQTRTVLREMWPKLRRQTVKDYVLFPLLAGPGAPFTFAGNAVANLGRNLWSFGIIFCGHFPDGALQFDAVEVVGESKDDWYVRQALGSANIEGGDLFHLMTGHLSFQIEHHLFPDLPARRYREMAPVVRQACLDAGIPYTIGPLHTQLASTAKRICAMAVPPGTKAFLRGLARR